MEITLKRVAWITLFHRDNFLRFQVNMTPTDLFSVRCGVCVACHVLIVELLPPRWYGALCELQNTLLNIMRPVLLRFIVPQI
jgi:hypothetical protein